MSQKTFRRSQLSFYNFIIEITGYLFSFNQVHIYFFPWRYSPFGTLAASHIRGFLNYFSHIVKLLGWVISPSQGLYLHRTTQHRKTWTSIHALSGIRTHDLSNKPAMTLASDRTATVTGCQVHISQKKKHKSEKLEHWPFYDYSCYINWQTRARFRIIKLIYH
jgi:hypothetical protein